jgi:hypothetical protein
MDPLHARLIEEIHIPRAPCCLVIPEAEQGSEGRRHWPAFFLPEVREARVAAECLTGPYRGLPRSLQVAWRSRALGA